MGARKTTSPRGNGARRSASRPDVSSPVQTAWLVHEYLQTIQSQRVQAQLLLSLNKASEDDPYPGAQPDDNGHVFTYADRLGALDDEEKTLLADMPGDARPLLDLVGKIARRREIAQLRAEAGEPGPDDEAEVSGKLPLG